MIFATSRSVLYVAYIAHVVTGVWCGGVDMCDARVCVLFVSSRSGIVFNPSTDAIIDHSQISKDIDPYFKSKLYVKDPSQGKPVPILSNDRSKPGERARVAQNVIPAIGLIRTS